MDPWNRKDAAVRTAILAMEDAKWEISQWLRAYPNTNAGAVAVSQQRIELLDKALAECRQSIAT